MKKALIIIMLLTMCLIISSCGDTTTVPTYSEDTTSLLTTASIVTTTQQTTDPITTTIGTTTETVVPNLTQLQVDAFSNEPVTLEFSYYLPSFQTEVIDALIADFESLYPNVDVVATRESDNRGVAVKYFSDYIGHQAADLILTNQEYIGIDAQILEPVEYFMNSSATLNGLTVGVSFEDFDSQLFTNFVSMDEYVTFPFTRMTQLVFANQTLLAENSIGIGNAGVQISDTGLLSHQSGLSLNELEAISTVIDDRFILLLELPNLTFETILGQVNVSLIQDNLYQINQTETTSLMTQLRSLSNAEIIALASYYEDNYSSRAFSNEDTVLAVSDVDSLRYMLLDMPFDVDILPMVEVGDTGAMFFGSDFGINQSSSNAEKFYAWMFIRYATDLSFNYIDYCIDAGYSPIYKPTIYEATQKYHNLIEIGTEYLTNNGNPEWFGAEYKWDYLAFSLIQFSYQVSRQNVYDREFFLAINSSEIEVARSKMTEYMEAIFYSNDEIGSLSSNLDQDLND